ncbi:uncharacterized protein LOC126702105 [Quercus robur]|uniref:uncharacterized protein LOC126702105 n=1 Tax=Quercus robur TaxID=38942 RepID=UPI002162E2C1|nr:uncharacterized protein LOC126702105 [Quercus robur]
MGKLEEACPTEDAVMALLEYLVSPMLPSAKSINQTPSLPQQQSVAKQMHAAVLLYNYYLRKQNPQLEVLGFEAFCKLSVVLKPTLLAHMKLMQSSDDTEIDDLKKQLSETEKRIMEACDISASLDASKDVPNIEGWPISKVAVLLVDSNKENFFLRFSSITQGVWSVIEKDVDISNPTVEGTVDANQSNKKKRFIRKPSKDESSVDESGLLQLAYAAVKEATGINQTDLMVSERHAVYSLSKEKTAARFYIMQCIKSVNEDVDRVPIKDTIDSLQGTLVRKSSSRWMVTPAVEYFHVRPYARIVSTWLSREVSSDSLPVLREGVRNSIVNSHERTERPCTPEIHKTQDRSPVSDGLVGGFGNNTRSVNTESLRQKNNNGSCMIGLSGSLTGPQSRDEDERFMVTSQNGEQFKNIANTIQVVSREENRDVDFSFMVPSQNGGKCENIANTMQVHNQQEKRTNCVEDDSNGSPSIVKDDEMMGLMTSPCVSECRGKQIAAGNKICNNILSVQGGRGDHALVAYQSTELDIDRSKNTSVSKQDEWSGAALLQNSTVPRQDELSRAALLQNFIVPKQYELSHAALLPTAVVSKQDELSCAALRVLLRKRDQLSLQQRNIEDEIALCDKKIQKILNGGEDDLALKIESVIEGCNDVCLRSITQERTKQQLEDQLSPQTFKRKRLSEAVLSMQYPCQELDRVCNESNWVLPTYCVFTSDGGYRANVTVNGVDFECTTGGDTRSNPREARESAAAQMLAKLRAMASSTP